MTIINNGLGNENKERLYENTTLIVPANGSAFRYVSSAEFCYCKDITPNKELLISYNDMPKVPLRIGDKYRKVMNGNGFLEKVEIFNPYNVNCTVELLSGAGDYENQAMSLIGVVEIETPAGADINVKAPAYTLGIPEEHTFDETGEVELDPAGAKMTRIQNTGSNNLRLYTADGFILAPLGTEEITLNAPFKVYGAEGDTLVFGRFS